jgi:hypothetical protein
MTLKLIGIHGPLNGGKDTVADYIMTIESMYSRYAFAKPIKDACKVLFSFSQEQLEDRILKEAVDPFWGFSPRKAMQLLGTEYGRDLLRKDIWIKRAELEVKNNLDRRLGTVITDVRFQNEADWIRSQPNSVLIYLEVPDLLRDEKYQHASEAGISRDSGDIVILNDKSKGLNTLYSQIDKIFS